MEDCTLEVLVGFLLIGLVCFFVWATNKDVEEGKAALARCAAAGGILYQGTTQGGKGQTIKGPYVCLRADAVLQ